MVRRFVGALTGPTVRFGASGLRSMNFVALARPLYVPSDVPAGVKAVRVVPRRFLEERASVACSSYQLLDFVASLELLIVEFRSAVYTVAVRSEDEVILFFEEAVITPVFFFRRLILRPDSSSEEV